jgi:hypothetical protein
MTVERIFTVATPRPTPYVRLYSFADWEANYPRDPVPGTQMDAELNAVQLSLTDTQNRLAQIQNDDGSLANGSVGNDQLDPDVLAIVSGGWNPRGVWVAGTAYAARDAVNAQGILWVAVKNHTASSNFTLDQQNGDWMFVMQPVAAPSIPVNPIPGVAAANVQDVLANLAARVTALEAAP